MIHNDIVCVENSLAVDYITSQGESGGRRGVGPGIIKGFIKVIN